MSYFSFLVFHISFSYRHLLQVSIFCIYICTVASAEVGGGVPH